MKMCNQQAFLVALRGFQHINLLLWKPWAASQNNPFVELLSYWRGKDWEHRSINIFWDVHLSSALGCKKSNERVSSNKITAASVKFLYINVRHHKAIMIYRSCNRTQAPWTGWLILAPRFANSKHCRTNRYIDHIHDCVALPVVMSACFSIASFLKPDKTPEESMNRAGNVMSNTKKRTMLQGFFF